MKLGGCYMNLVLLFVKGSIRLTEILDEGNLSQLGYQTFSELKEEFLVKN
jgi:hypothetical protein